MLINKSIKIKKKEVPLYDQVMEKIVLEYKGVMFGSRRWNCFNAYSDYDYVMPVKQANMLKAFLSGKGVVIRESDYYVSGYYFTINDMKINITGCKKPHFNAWKSAIQMMDNAPVKDLGYDSRKALFEMILAFLKYNQYDKGYSHADQ